MAVPKSNQKAVAKYMKNNYDEIKIRVLKVIKKSSKHMPMQKMKPQMNLSSVQFMKRWAEREQKKYRYYKKMLPNMLDPEKMSDHRVGRKYACIANEAHTRMW